MIRILTGDCREVLRTLDADSFDSCVTDPPYHLTTGKKGGTGEASVSLATPHGRARVTTGFMGMRWDGGDVAFKPETWVDVLRVLKPGAFLLAFGGTRTYHRLVCAIEDAGFEVRDMVAWLYGSGFPKGTDKAKIPAEWAGWNTALKPAVEPICLARKPMIGTLAENLKRYGTGALFIDGCRVGAETRTNASRPRADRNGFIDGFVGGTASATHDYGRWPANVLHDGSDEVIAAFPDAPGQLMDQSSSSSRRKNQTIYGAMKVGNGRAGEPSADSDNDGLVGFRMKLGARRGDAGSAARFFWSPKASRADRNDGLHGMPETVQQSVAFGERQFGTLPFTEEQREMKPRPRANSHPTVKPTDLMRYLCRLVTPPVVWYCPRCEGGLSDSSKTTDSVTAVRDVRGTVQASRQQQSGPVLHQGLCGPFDGATAEGMRAVRRDVQAETERNGSTAESLLQSSLCFEVDGIGEAKRGRPDHDEGVHHDPRAGSSDGDRRGLCDAASSCDGGSAGPDAPADGGRSPHQRGQDGQPSGEFGVDAEDAPRPSAEAEAQADQVPPLSRADRGQRTCASCEGHLAQRAGVVLDPFMGSGSTLKGAELEGFEATGIELNPEYIEIARRRIASDFPLFAEVA